MKIFRKGLSLIIALVMLISCVPITVFADTPETEYSISNGYLTYTINNKTGGFSIVTRDGHPQKKYDNNIPLLYKEDKTRSNGTSFITVRIDGKDYIFGQSYGIFGISSHLHEPVVSEEGRLLTVQWDIKGYSIIQRIALSYDEKSDITGNVGISYEILNNNDTDGEVGLRLLLDTALDNNVDAPYVITDYNINPQYIEKEYSGVGLPQQIRLLDSLNSPKKMAYLILKGWNAGVVPDKVIVGHWANLANTKYSYSADPFCDFSNYSNKYRTADSAIALYWSESTIAAGASKTVEALYGVGNFSYDTILDNVGIDIVTEKVSLTNDRKAYKDDGEFDVTVTIDNSVDYAEHLIEPMLIITADSGLSVVGESTANWTEIKVGETKTVSFKVKADKQATINSKMIYASLSSTVMRDEKAVMVSANATRHILLPAVTGVLPDIQMNTLKPNTVYSLGDKAVTISGRMNEFSALKASTNWNLYLEHTSTNHEVLINKKDISFIDDTYTALSFKTNEELIVGDYKIVFRFTDIDLIEGFGAAEITASCVLHVSADEYFKQSSYGILSLVRYDKSKYKFVKFASEYYYDKFYDGDLTVDGIRHDFSLGDLSNYEIMLTIRGRIMELEKEVAGETIKYYQASSNDSPITINNILNYRSDVPLTIQKEANVYTVSGDGRLNVIDSITVWKYKWSFNVIEGKTYTLNTERYKTNNVDEPEDLILKLDGAGIIAQSIAGFLINLKYGVMNSKLQNDFNKTTTYGISFGGNISIPIKSEESEDKDKDDPFAKGNLTVEIDDILYGEKARIEDDRLEIDGTGFIGIDATVSFVLPKDVLGKLIKNAPGVKATLVINTIKNKYFIDMGVKLKVIECQGILSFEQVKVKNSEKIVPDRIEFYIRDGLRVPIVPPHLFMTGIGGGIRNLAATIGGDTINGLPPVTIVINTKLELLKKMIGDLNGTISLMGMDIEGVMNYNGKKGLVDIDAGLSTSWVDPWYIDAFGSISVIDGILKGGLTIKIAEDYFYGYIYAKICIPDSIPIIGGKEVNGVEAAVTNTYIGATVRVIGIKFGVIYYWDGDYDFGKGIDIKEKSFMRSSFDVSEDTSSDRRAEFLYGTNIRPLNHKVVTPKYKMMSVATASQNIEFDSDGVDAVIIEIPYTGYLASNPNDNITISYSEGDIILVEDDGKGGGNYLVQDRGSEGRFIYVSITDKSIISHESFTLTVNNPSLSIGEISVNGVKYLPELTSTAYTYDDEEPFKLDVSWTTDAVYDADAVLDIYLTKDKDILEKIKTSVSEESLGISVNHIELDRIQGGSTNVDLPDTLESGRYYVLTTMSSKSSGISLAISNASFDFRNPNLPGEVEAVELKYAGNGRVNVEISDTIDPSDEDDTYYLVELITSEGDSVYNAYGEFAYGDDIVLGDDTSLIPGQSYKARVRKLMYRDGKSYYGDKTKESVSEFIMPTMQKPSIVSISSNLDSEYLNTSDFSVRYEFDRPVKMIIYKNSEAINLGATAQNVWTYSDELDDGTYLIDFIAYTENNDYISGSDLGKELGFIVDTIEPVLSIGEKTSESLHKEGASFTTTSFGASVVFTDSTGKYTVPGLSESKATLYVNGKREDIIEADGSFEYEGTVTGKAPYTELVFEAVDKAENKASTIVNVVNQKYVAIDSLELLANGKPIIRDSDDILTLNLKEGDTVKLSVLGKNVDTSIAIDNSELQWHVLYEKRLISLDEGIIKALGVGQTAVRVKYITSLLADGTVIGPEDYVVINIAENVTKVDDDIIIDDDYFILRASASEHGRIQLSNSIAKKGTSVTITAIPDAGYRVYDIIINGVSYGNKKQITIPAINENLFVSAIFVEIWHDSPFTDINEDDWFYNWVEEAYKLNIIKGTSENTFSPYSPMTRAMFVTVLGRIEGVTEQYSEIASFKDVPNGSWFTAFVEWAKDNGIVDGVGDGTFAPDKDITREQVAVLLYRYAKFIGLDVSVLNDSSINSYEDSNKISDYARVAMQWAIERGIINGVSSTELNPLGNASRAEVVTMIVRFIKMK